MEQVIRHFYESFQNLNGDEMALCYHDAIEFQDPAFGSLHGERAKNMWRMLCDSQKGKNFKVIFSEIEADSEQGSAHWEAFYTFSKTGRTVHNSIEAKFEFKDGKIINHCDDFNLHHWAKQAMGIKGWILGGTGFFRNKLQTQTNNLLSQYERKNS